MFETLFVLFIGMLLGWFFIPQPQFMRDLLMKVPVVRDWMQ